MLIPKKIKPYYEKKCQSKDGENNYVEGTLCCCNSHVFEVYVVGEVKSGNFLINRMWLEGDIIGMDIRCKICGNIIPVFDSRYDGYDHSGENQYKLNNVKAIGCKKCKNDSFSITVKYEYPDVEELRFLGIEEIDNAFTWIYITIKCDKCGTRYKNFIDYEVF